jgi:hypothetical protein
VAFWISWLVASAVVVVVAAVVFLPRVASISANRQSSDHVGRFRSRRGHQYVDIVMDKDNHGPLLGLAGRSTLLR